MPEVRIKLSGWQAVAVLVVLIGIVAARFATFRDRKGDKDLMKHVETQLRTEYSGHVAEAVKTAVDAKDPGTRNEAVDSVMRDKLTVVSVQVSSPLFDFSLPRDVVAKVEFSMDAAGKGDKRTVYYLFRQNVFGWQFQRKTSAASYYLNFK